MSKRWPKLWGATTAPIEADDFHPHQAEDISGGTFNDVVKFGDVRSYNWDGGSDLSTKDTTATAGYLLDASEGAAQFETVYAEGGELGDLSVTGTLTLAGSGKIVTAASGQRIEITATSADRIQLFSGHDDEASPGLLLAVNSTIDPDAPLTTLQSPSVTGLASGTVTLRPGTTGSSGTGGAYINPIIFEGTVSSAVRVFSPNHLPQADTELDGPTIGTWTPTLTATTTNPTLSTDASHTATGEYVKVGNLVKAWVFIEFGTAGVNAGSGQYLIDTPTTAAKPTISGNNQPSVGSGRIFDSDGADTYLVDVRLTDTGHVRMRYDQQTASGNVGAAIPFTFAAGDYIVIHFEYLEA